MVRIPLLSTVKITEAVGGTVVHGKLEDGVDLEVTQLGAPRDVTSGSVAFIISESFIKDVSVTKATVLVVQAAFAERVLAQLSSNVKVVISCPDAYVGLAQLSKVIAELDALADWRLGAEKSLAAIHPSAEIASTVRLAPGVVVCEGARVGERTVLLSNVVVGPGVSIGSECVIFPGVVIYPRTQIGSRVRIHANSVLGSDGFGYARGTRGSVKIWHLGRVLIEDDVEIGAGTMIDRGTMKDTIIERGAKIDNLCQIGHNGHVKAHAVLCAQVGLAGNVTVGRGAILAGKVGVADKIDIGDGAIIGPMVGLSKDAKAGEVYMGSIPGRPRREWWRMVALIDKLPGLIERVKQLEGKKS